MLEAAQLYKDEIQCRFAEHMYDVEYQYYFGGIGTRLPEIPDNNYDVHFFASTSEEHSVIGIISYSVDLSTRSCSHFAIMSFFKGYATFGRDVKRAIDDIFYKYHFNRVDFICYAENPALRHYRQFIKKYGGREVGVWRQYGATMDGRLQDAIMFEILRDEYYRNGVPKAVQ